MISYETGDLFDPEFNFDAVAHGCNCRGAMGGGIAAVFGQRFPHMREQYEHKCHDDRGFLALRPGGIFPYVFSRNQVNAAPFLCVYNLMTQLNPGADARINAIRTSVRKMCIHATEHGYSKIGVPRIGAGIGGLEWDDVAEAIWEGQSPWDKDIDIVVVTRPEDADKFDN